MDSLAEDPKILPLTLKFIHMKNDVYARRPEFSSDIYLLKQLVSLLIKLSIEFDNEVGWPMFLRLVPEVASTVQLEVCLNLLSYDSSSLCEC